MDVRSLLACGLAFVVFSSPASASDHESIPAVDVRTGRIIRSSQSREFRPRPIHGTSANVKSQVLAATVRLTVDGTNGSHRGSGTIVSNDSNGRAIIATCGHLFDGVGENPFVTVTLFDEGREVELDGKLLTADIDVDVAIVSVSGVFGVQPIPLADEQTDVHYDMPVIVAGCDRGGTPRAEETTVCDVGRFVGFTNYIVEAEPPHGRSGGGLVTEAGELIAVCQGVELIGYDGVYVGLGSIHREFRKIGLSPRGRGIKTSSDASRQPTPPTLKHDPIAGDKFSPLVDVTCTIRLDTSLNGERVVQLKNVSPEFLEALRDEEARQSEGN